MFTVSASSSQRSERVTNRSTTPAERATTTATSEVPARARRRRSTCGAGRCLRPWSCSVTVSHAISGRPRRAKRSRLSLVREVAEPQHELASSRRRRTPAPSRPPARRVPDEVVADVVSPVRRSAPELAAAGRVEPGREVALGVEEPAVGAVGAHDRARSRARRRSQWRAQHLRLVHELLEPDLPVGLVGVLGRDAQRHLLAAAADPDLRQLLERLRDRSTRRRAARAGPRTSTVSSVHRRFTTVERLLEHRAAASRPAGTSQPYAWYSRSYQPAPSPRMSRPPEITSTPAASFASSPALRYDEQVTSWPSRIVLGVLRQRGQGRERLEHVRRLAARHGLDVVVDPEVVVAELLGELRELDRCAPTRRPRPSRCTRASSPGARTRRSAVVRSSVSRRCRRVLEVPVLHLDHHRQQVPRRRSW